MKNKPKEYKIKTIADIRKIVNEKNLEGFLIDFSNFLNYSVQMKNLAEATGVEVNFDDFFNWIDDGKNNVNITINVNEPKNKK